MNITNLAQLKRAAVVGAEFEIVAHRRADFIGQVRKITKSSTSGMYAVVSGQPNHIVSQENDGKGYYIKWDKAANWDFDNGVCSLYHRCPRQEEKRFIMSIKFRRDPA